jgi:heme exporter protein B
MEDGTLDQLASRGIAMETVAAAPHPRALDRLCPATAGRPAAGRRAGSASRRRKAGRLALALLLGTPALAALAVVAAALTAGLRGGGALAGLIILPLALPILIFGVGAASPGALKLLAAASLVSLALAPFAAAAALRQE